MNGPTAANGSSSGSSSRDRELHLAERLTGQRQCRRQPHAVPAAISIISSSIGPSSISENELTPEVLDRTPPGQRAAPPGRRPRAASPSISSTSARNRSPRQKASRSRRSSSRASS